MKGLVQKILKGTYPPLPEVYSSDLKKLLSEMLTKDPNKRPSIRKILEMPFMKAKINELFSSTIKIHELKLEKENTLNKPEIMAIDKHKHE
jgi:NIMA (never in mitosis gene a)-related kinase 1/4/5